MAPRRPQDAPGCSRTPQEPPGGPQQAPGRSRMLQDAPGASRRPQDAPGGPRRLQETPGGSRRSAFILMGFIGFSGLEVQVCLSTVGIYKVLWLGGSNMPFYCRVL